MRSGIALVVVGIAVLVWWGMEPAGRERGSRSAERPTEAASARPDSAEAENSAPPPVDLSLVDRVRDLHGVVVRKRDGEPVPGARLTVCQEPWRPVQLRADFMDRVEEKVATAISSIDGTFAIPLEFDRNYQLRVEKEGFARYELRLTRRGGRLRVELEEGSALRIRVVDSEGTLVEGARVEVVAFDAWRSRSLHRGTTDAAGEAAWTSVPRTPLIQVEVEHPDHGYFRTGYRHSPGELVTVAYPAARTIRGRVLDANTEQPIANARVGMGNRLDGAVPTDGEGRFVLHGWTGRAPGGVLCAEAPGYALNGVRVRNADQVEIELSTGGSIIGRVVDADGAPIAGARAVLESTNSVGREFLYQQRRCVSGVDGGIRFDGIGTNPKPEISSHRLFVFADGYARFERSIWKRVEQGEPLDIGEIRLASPNVLSVTVIRAGEPVKRNLVALKGPIARPGTTSAHGAYMHATTDDLGRVRFGALPLGHYEVWLRTEGAPGVRQAVELTSSAQDLVVELAAGRPVQFTVVDETGSAIAQARIRAQSNDGGFYATTNNEGVATLHVPPETREVRVEGPLERSTLFSRAGKVYALDPARDEMRIVHTNKIPIRGVVVLEDGRAADRPAVRALRGDSAVGDGAGNERGEFTVYVTPGSSCRLEVYGEAPQGIGIPGDLVGTMENVAPGAQEVRIVARADARRSSLRVIAVAPDGRPLPGVFVTNRLGKGAFADENGVVQLDDLPASSILLLGFDPKARCAHPEPVRVQAEGQTIPLRFRTGVEVRIRLLSGGEPLPRQSCFLHGESTRGNLESGDAGWILFMLPEKSKEQVRISVFARAGQVELKAVTADRDGESFDLRKMYKR